MSLKQKLLLSLDAALLGRLLWRLLNEVVALLRCVGW